MKIIIRNRQDFRRACRELYRYFTKYARHGKPIKVEIKRALLQRSLQQNRYYWGVIVKMIADYTGHEPDEVHSFLKMQFLRQTDGVIEWVRSTTELTTAEFFDYCEKCRMWALENFNLAIPTPDEAVVWEDAPKKDIPF